MKFFPWINARLILLVAASILLLGFFAFRQLFNANGSPANSRPQFEGGQASAMADHGDPETELNAGGISKSNAKNHLLGILSELKATTYSNQATKILNDLRAYLDSLPPSLASAVMTEFLANPDLNATTHADFSIGGNGSLDGYPSLRVALLDWIAQIDPQQALVVAKQVLSSPDDADEWAVSLRNFAHVTLDPLSREFLRTKTEELIRNPGWRENPSIGYFQSFDVLVQARATESTGLLSDLVSDRSPEGAAIAHAAFLTLDRLTIREPVVMMEQLASRKALCESRGEMVANMFARADLGDPVQQQLVRSYLLDPDRTEAEIRAFTGVYPNANFAISKNLLSENLTLTRKETVDRIASGLLTVDGWLTDPSFSMVEPYLNELHLRLETILSQAAPKTAECDSVSSHIRKPALKSTIIPTH